MVRGSGTSALSEGLNVVPQMEPMMINLKVLSIAAAMSLVLPLAASTESFAQLGSKLGGAPPSLGGGGGGYVGGGAHVPRYSGSGGGVYHGGHVGGYRRHGGGGFIPGAVIGGVIGGAIASQSYGYYGAPYGYGYYDDGYYYDGVVAVVPAPSAGMRRMSYSSPPHT